MSDDPKCVHCSSTVSESAADTIGGDKICEECTDALEKAVFGFSTTGDQR